MYMFKCINVYVDVCVCVYVYVYSVYRLAAVETVKSQVAGCWTRATGCQLLVVNRQLPVAGRRLYISITIFVYLHAYTHTYIHIIFRRGRAYERMRVWNDKFDIPSPREIPDRIPQVGCTTCTNFQLHFD